MKESLLANNIPLPLILKSFLLKRSSGGSKLREPANQGLPAEQPLKHRWWWSILCCNQLMEFCADAGGDGNVLHA